MLETQKESAKNSPPPSSSSSTSRHSTERPEVGMCVWGEGGGDICVGEWELRKSPLPSPRLCGGGEKLTHGCPTIRIG